MEWRDEFNSFNSWKGLLYASHYKNIADWGKTGSGLLPPIEASLDPIEQCQLKCNHCNAGRYIGSGNENRMEDNHLYELIDYLSFWGVKAICFGGGGEPSLHSKLSCAIERTTSYHGLEAAVATNGVVMTDSLLDAYSQCRWVGISVDAGTRSTYLKGKKADHFDDVILNVGRLAARNRNTSFKFLIFDYNQHEIYAACCLAKELGVRDFHARPADMRHQGLTPGTDCRYDVNLINEQLARCRELDDQNFRVYTITHKFKSDFMPKKEFSQCYASPLCIQLSADGNIYLCPDTRHMDFFKLGSHADVRDIDKIWGSQEHYGLVFKTGCANCNSRCTFGAYNEQCERLFINNDDPFYKNFV